MRRAFHRWLATVGDSSAAGSIYTRLTALYQAPWRRYHTLGHVLACLSILDEFQADAGGLSEGEARLLTLALWFHDAVYDPRRKDNEEQSGRLAVESCHALGFRSIIKETVLELILATAHFGDEAAPAASAGQLTAVMRDIDLSVLGASPAAFAWYDWAVRQEYAHRTDQEYEEGRRAVCMYFLQQPQLYRTTWFAGRYESRARANLVARIARNPGTEA